MSDGYEVFPGNEEWKNRLRAKAHPKWTNSGRHISLSEIVDLVFDYYVHNESMEVKRMFGEARRSHGIRCYMQDSICSQNPFLREHEYRPLLVTLFPATLGSATPQNPAFFLNAVERGIRIPQDIVFFRQAFPSGRVTGGDATITLDDGVLNALSFNGELEDIVAEEQTKDIGSLKWDTQDELHSALSRMGLCDETATDIRSVTEGIQLFRKIYSWEEEDLSGNPEGTVDSATVLAINDMLNQGFSAAGRFDGIIKGGMSERGINLLMRFEDPPVYDPALRGLAEDLDVRRDDVLATQRARMREEGWVPYVVYVALENLGKVNKNHGRIGLHMPKGDGTVTYAFGEVVVRRVAGRSEEELRRLMEAERGNYHDMTIEEAKEYLIEKVAKSYIDDVNDTLRGKNSKIIMYDRLWLNQCEFDAVTSMYYNAGGIDEIIDKIILEKDNPNTFSQNMQNYISNYRPTVEGVVQRGLLTRRGIEADVFLRGIYPEDFLY